MSLIHDACKPGLRTCFRIDEARQPKLLGICAPGVAMANQGLSRHNVISLLAAQVDDCPDDNDEHRQHSANRRCHNCTG